VSVRRRARRPPLLSMPVGLLVGRQLDDQEARLSVLEALLVVGRLRGALGVHHEDLGHKEGRSGLLSGSCLVYLSFSGIQY